MKNRHTDPAAPGTERGAPPIAGFLGASALLLGIFEFRFDDFLKCRLGLRSAEQYSVNKNSGSAFDACPDAVLGRVYVFDSTMFSNTLNASADPAQLLVSSVPVGQDLSGLFPAGAVLASASHTSPDL
jgi:hypothetical protein